MPDLSQYMTGNLLIDLQHRKLFQLIDSLAVSEGDGVETVLAGLVDYARYHFRVEEDLMVAYDYPERRGHHREHDAFRSRVEALEKPNDPEEAKRLAQTLSVWLRNWLVEHIDHVDRKLAVHLSSTEV